mgnify:CR=1 FL=1
MKFDEKFFGTTHEGESVEEFRITNENGVSFAAINYGATLTSVKAPDRNGRSDNLILGFDKLEQYLGSHPYIGATVGRCASRIKDGTFTLDGVTHQLDCNEGSHHLHGGPCGFSHSVWRGAPFEEDSVAGVKFRLRSPHGDQGYPGTVDVSVTFSLSEANELTLSYEAETDQPTPINLTNHAYWNLGGECSGKVYDHELCVNAPKVLTFDDDLIPTGEIQSVEGTPYDLRSQSRIGEHIRESGGFDNCFVLSGTDKSDHPAAEVFHPVNGRRMQIFTDFPALQLYTANYLQNMQTRCGWVHPHEAYCLETQDYPDAVNHANFPDVVLRPGQTYRRKTVHKFSVS